MLAGENIGDRCLEKRSLVSKETPICVHEKLW